MKPRVLDRVILPDAGGLEGYVVQARVHESGCRVLTVVTAEGVVFVEDSEVRAAA